MLYVFAHFLRDKMPFLWNIVDIVNSFLFSQRYGKKLKVVESSFTCYKVEIGYDVLPISLVDPQELFSFFFHQPEEAYTFFKPHGFDVRSIKKMQKNNAFLAYVLRDTNNGNIAGYCFNRSFFHGKGFRGRMVDINYRGKGLGTLMNRILNDIGFGIGLQLFETVSKDNIASYRSAVSASNFKVVKELPHNELYLEILKD